MSYCEMPEFYYEKRVKARKPHKCCETGRVIQPGEYYWRIRMKFDGDLYSYAQSDAAYHFARYLNHDRWRDVMADGCIPFGGIGEAVAECREDDVKAEWERVKRGEVTRDTTVGMFMVDGAEKEV